MPSLRLRFLSLLAFISITAVAQQNVPNLRKRAHKSSSPSEEIVRLDIDKDGRPDILERCGMARVRWLDETTTCFLQTPAVIRSVTFFDR
jgi:hypothetical protein